MKKLIISSDALKPALSKVGQAVNAKSVLPILTNLFCKVTPGQLELISSNIEMTIYYRVECEAKESFEFLLPYDLVTKIVSMNKYCPLEFEVGKTVKIKGPGDTFEIKLSDKIADFPKLQDLPKKSSFNLTQDVLSCLHTALPATSKVEGSKVSNVLLELSAGKITVASTDGAYIVFSKEFPGEQQDTEELLISAKVIKALEGCKAVKVCYHSKAIGFEADKITIISTRSDDKFVNFRQVFPADWPANININRYDMVAALDKCTLSIDELRTATITVNESEMLVHADDHRIDINVTLKADYNSPVKQFKVNYEKLLLLLNQVEQTNIDFAIHASDKAIILSCADDPGYRGMIMPIATKN